MEGRNFFEYGKRFPVNTRYQELAKYICSIMTPENYNRILYKIHNDAKESKEYDEVILLRHIITTCGLENFPENKYKIYSSIFKIIPKTHPNGLNVPVGQENMLTHLINGFPDKKWDHMRLLENPNITWEIVQANLDKDWNYIFLSKNPNITWDIVQANPQIKWDYFGLSQNPNITWEIVRDNIDKDWNYILLSKNPNITWDIVRANPQIKWDYEFYLKIQI